jgi:hypothetical protein
MTDSEKISQVKTHVGRLVHILKELAKAIERAVEDGGSDVANVAYLLKETRVLKNLHSQLDNLERDISQPN